MGEVGGAEYVPVEYDYKSISEGRHHLGRRFVAGNEGLTGPMIQCEKKGFD